MKAILWIVPILFGIGFALIVIGYGERSTIKVGRIVQNNRVYKISIDTVETDKLFGKEWRTECR
jgi:hypothetical protein